MKRGGRLDHPLFFLLLHRLDRDRVEGFDYFQLPGREPHTV